MQKFNYGKHRFCSTKATKSLVREYPKTSINSTFSRINFQNRYYSKSKNFKFSQQRKKLLFMEIAKVFENGRCQAIILPKKFRFDVDKVIVQRLGKAVVLVPQNTIWDTFMNGINNFTDDCFTDERLDIPTTREKL